MDIFPAIDIKDGKVVRLFNGDYDKEERYSITPLDAARFFHDQGAKNLHIVDLDGAKNGELSNFPVIEKIVSETDMFIQVGGGIRDEKRIEKYMCSGVSRVILGTIAIQDFAFLIDMIKKYKEKIAVGIDEKNGFAAVNGWTDLTKVDSMEFCKRVRDIGVKTVVYTDISKDGAMEGPNIDIYRKLVKIKGIDIIASGGISSCGDIAELSKLRISGAIIGKALYKGHLSLADALKYSERM